MPVYAFSPQTNGTLLRFRADERTGELSLSGGPVQTGINRLVEMVFSADKRFLYVYPAYDDEKDGIYWEFTTPEREKAARSKPTPLVVFALEPGGNLRRVQSQRVPGPIGFLLPHPGGRFVLALSLYSALLLQINGSQNKRGELHVKARLPVYSGMDIFYGPSTLSAWHLAFSPSGDTLYDHYLRGFDGDSHGCLRRYRFNSASGTIQEAGPEQSEFAEKKTEELWGGVWAWKNQTAFLQERRTFRVCRADKSGGLTQTQMLTGTRENAEPTPVLLTHPQLPLVIYRLSFADPYTVLRVTAPGKVEKVGAFASAFGKGEQRLATDPDGRFLYETNAPWKSDKSDKAAETPSVAVFALSPDGTKAEPSVPPAPFPLSGGAELTLVGHK